MIQMNCLVNERTTVDPPERPSDMVLGLQVLTHPGDQDPS